MAESALGALGEVLGDKQADPIARTAAATAVLQFAKTSKE